MFIIIRVIFIFYYKILFKLYQIYEFGYIDIYEFKINLENLGKNILYIYILLILNNL